MTPKKAKRGRPAGADPVVRVTFSVPGGLFKRAKKKAKTEKVALSSVVARLLGEWTA